MKNVEKGPQNSGKKHLSKNTKALTVVIIAIVLLGGILALIVFCMPTLHNPNKQPLPIESTYPTDANGREYAVDLKGNKIENDLGVSRDKDGKIISDGVIEITNKGPLAVSKIQIQNESGSYTILSKTPTEETTDAQGNKTSKTKETVYTLIGFENEPLQSEQVSSIANQASNIKTKAIVDIKGENLKDYGLDEPRSKVVTTFTDYTFVAIDIGNDAPDNLGTYIKYPDKKGVYLVKAESLNNLMLSTLDLLDRNITNSSNSEKDTDIKELKLSGQYFPDPVTIVPNDDKTCDAYYKMTTPKKQFVSVTNGSKAISAIRGLISNGVVCYHPNSKQLSQYGLSNPAVKLQAKYNDTSYNLSASTPQKTETENDIIYIYNHDKKIVYKTSSSTVPWAGSNYNDLRYEYIARPIQNKLSSIEITSGGKTYRFSLEQIKKTDNKGNETTSTKIMCNHQKITESKFGTYFDNLTMVQRSGNAENKDVRGAATLIVKYNYNNGKSPDTIKYFKADNKKMLAQVNGETDSYVFETYTSKIISDTPKIARNKTVTPI